MADIVEDIKGRLGIYDLVSQYVQLKKAGLNYKGLCPFHGEKTPSFVVSPEKQICHCFGCGKGGDIFSFIQELEGVTFPEALEVLADKAGVKIDQKKMKKSLVNNSVKDLYFEAQELACQFFEKQLWETKDGEKVLGYLAKRGVKDGDVKEFRLGFAPDDYNLLNQYLLEKGIAKETILKSGLAASKEVDQSRIYDKYRARLIFPIFNYLGKVAGFGGRALKRDQMPKYFNSPENVIYNKSKILYGLSHAKSAIKARKQVVLVEGYFDVVLPYQVGVENVVATSGTALTKEQVRLLKRLTTNVVACFDSDDAGFEATKRAYALVADAGMVMKVVSGLGKKDPADYVLEDGADFQKMVDEAVDFIIFYIDELIERFDVNSFEGQRAVLNELMPFFKKMKAVERDFFVRDLAGKMGVNERHLYDQINSYRLPSNHPSRGSQQQSVDQKSFRLDIDSCLLALFLEYPKLFESELIDLFDEGDDSDKKAIYKVLADQYNSLRDDLEKWNFENEVLTRLKAKISVWRLYIEHHYQNFSLVALAEEVKILIDKIRKSREAGRLKNISLLIAEAEKKGDLEEMKSLLIQQQKLLSSNKEI